MWDEKLLVGCILSPLVLYSEKTSLSEEVLNLEYWRCIETDRQEKRYFSIFLWKVGIPDAEDKNRIVF